MVSLPDQIIVLLTATAFWVFIFYLAAYRPVIFIGLFFVLFTLLWRTASTAFIDLAGPVWSAQTMRFVGPGLATPLHVLAYFVTIVPFMFVLRADQIRAWHQDRDGREAAPSQITLADITFILSSLFLAWLFADLIRRGSIPFFAETERYEYTRNTGGPAHRWVVTYGSFLSFWWGVMFASERLRTGKTRLRHLCLLAILIVYIFMTGNRFSAFYSLSSYFIIPLAAVVAQTETTRSSIPFHWVTQAFKRREVTILATGLSLVVVLAATAIVHNLVAVRGYRGAEVRSEFWERVLVQPSEMGWISYERVFVLDQWQPDRAFNLLFQTPLDPGKNTTPQYLMLETIGEPRTSEHIYKGFQFAGGFPEIFFELFGPFYAWPILLGSGFITALLTAHIVRGTLQGRYASTFMSLYLLYGFLVMYIGGMLNFVAVGTYWIKVAAFALTLVLEAGLARHGLPLVPWSIGSLRLGRWTHRSIRQKC